MLQLSSTFCSELRCSQTKTDTYSVITEVTAIRKMDMQNTAVPQRTNYPSIMNYKRNVLCGN